MKKIAMIILASIFVFTGTIEAQKYFTREGLIEFSSDAPLEKITAENQTATAVLDATSGRIEWAVLIKAFQFEKALMQEHFNENYMESGKFPKAFFKGYVVNMKDVNTTEDGTYDVIVKGDLTIHGVTQAVEKMGKISVQDGQLSAVSAFDVAVADYDITIPKVVRENVAKTVQIKVNAKLQKLEK